MDRRRIDDNLRRLELGLLTLPDEADPIVFLLSDGRVAESPRASVVRSLRDLFDRYLESIPDETLEQATISGMKIHIAHLYRVLGERFCVQELELPDLQRYAEQRAKEPGLRGTPVRPATLKKRDRDASNGLELGASCEVAQASFSRAGVTLPQDHRGAAFPNLW